MNKYRQAPTSANFFKVIDNFGNFVCDYDHYFMETCPRCHSKNPNDHISSGECVRCGYKLTAKDEE